MPNGVFMTNEYVHKLASTDPRERLKAARHFAENAEHRQITLLEQALAIETVSWVASALKRAIQRATPSVARHPLLEKSDISPDQTAEIYSEALEVTSKQIIHEIEPILGVLRLSASSEVPDFEGSDTKRGLDRMAALMAGLASLRRAASSPMIDEFSLAQAISEWVEEESGSRAVRILRAGRQEGMIETDKGLIYLGFINGLRNAIDATLALKVEESKFPDITVNWGITDRDVWLAIIDAGVGFRGNIAKAFEIGTTTKADHLGMGLATAQQSMTSIGGSVRLIPEEQGVRFEMRWPKVII